MTMPITARGDTPTALTTLPIAWPFAAPVARPTRMTVCLVFGPGQTRHALARATTPHPRTGRASYDLLPEGEGIVLWSTPAMGWWDPSADHVGTILFDPAHRLWHPDGNGAVISALLVCPPYSLADVLAYVSALFGEPPVYGWGEGSAPGDVSSPLAAPTAQEGLPMT